MAELLVTTPDSKETVDLTDFPMMVGRMSENDLVYDDTRLSRRHCVIKRRGNRYFIEDLDSKNGTYVNGKKTDQTVLNDGDQIEIGEIRIRFRQTDSEQEAGAALESGSSPGQEEAKRLVTWVNPFQTTTSPSVDWRGPLLKGIIWIAVLALIVCGGYVVYQPIKAAGSQNNLLGRTGSLTGASDKWTFNASSVETLDGKQVFGLSLSPEQPRSSVQYSPPLPIDPSTSYVIETRLKAMNLSGLSGVHIQWLEDTDAEHSEELVLPVRKSTRNWVRKTSRSIQPPSGVSHMKLSFFAAGEQGTVFIDRPVLRKKPSSSNGDDRIQMTFDQLSLSLDQTGQLVSTNSSSGRLLQSGLRFHRDGRTSPGWTTSIMNRSEDQSSVRWTGTAFTPSTFQPVHFGLDVSTSKRPRLSYSLPKNVSELVDEVGFQFRHRGSETPSSLTVLTPDGMEKTGPDQVRENTHGIQLTISGEPVLVQFSRPMTVQFRQKPGSSVRNVRAFAPADSVSSPSGTRSSSGNRDQFELELTLSRPGDVRTNQALRPSPSPDRIEELLASKQFGKAYSSLKKLQPFDRFDDQKEAYNRLFEEIQTRVSGAVNRIRETLDTARKLDSTFLVRRGLKELKKWQRRLGDQSAEFELPGLEDELKEAKKTVEQNQRENRGRKLYDTFLTYRESGKTKLAVELAREIVSRYSSTEYKRKASAFLEKQNNSN